MVQLFELDEEAGLAGAIPQLGFLGLEASRRWAGGRRCSGDVC
ncbi:hypothetical protein COLU111180_15575 [Cohnella lubricantis]|nr:hypothetical protein [Cohnella lubricantis]MBP2119721.1 hypothetical protein [Cohnella lubricantis]